MVNVMLLNKEKAAGALEDHEAEREPSRQGKCLRREAFAAGSQPARALRGQILFTGKPSHLGMDGMAFFCREMDCIPLGPSPRAYSDSAPVVNLMFC